MTPIQAVARASLSKRQLNSISALQNKVETTPAMFTRVSPAQFKAMQQAYTAVKSAGLPIPAEMIKVATELGLK